MLGLAEFVTSKARRTTVKELCELRRNEVNFDATCALRVKSRLTRPWTSTSSGGLMVECPLCSQKMSLGSGKRLDPILGGLPCGSEQQGSEGADAKAGLFGAFSTDGHQLHNPSEMCIGAATDDDGNELYPRKGNADAGCRETEAACLPA